MKMEGPGTSSGPKVAGLDGPKPQLLLLLLLLSSSSSLSSSPLYRVFILIFLSQTTG